MDEIPTPHSKPLPSKGGPGWILAAIGVVLLVLVVLVVGGFGGGQGGETAVPDTGGTQPDAAAPAVVPAPTATD